MPPSKAQSGRPSHRAGSGIDGVTALSLFASLHTTHGSSGDIFQLQPAPSFWWCSAWRNKAWHGTSISRHLETLSGMASSREKAPASERVAGSHSCISQSWDLPEHRKTPQKILTNSPIKLLCLLFLISSLDTSEVVSDCTEAACCCKKSIKPAPNISLKGHVMVCQLTTKHYPALTQSPPVERQSEE